MEYDGGSIKAITDDSLYPLFPHDGQVGATTNGFAAMDLATLNALHLYYTQDSLYLTTITSDEPPPVVIVITFDCPISFGTVGEPYEYTLTATGGIEPYTWSIISGALPDNLTLDGSTGIISGTPIEDGDFSFTFQVEDAEGNIETKSCGMSVISGECTEFTAPEVWANLGAGEVGDSLGGFNSVTAISVSANWINIGMNKATSTFNNDFAFAPRTPTPGINDWSDPPLPVVMNFVSGLYALSDEIVYIGTALGNDSRVYQFDRTPGTFTNLLFPDSNTDRITIQPSTTDTDIFYAMTQARLLGGDGSTLWTYRISTATWTQIGGDALNGSWNLPQNNANTTSIAEGTDGFLYVAVGGGTANLAQVWRGNMHVTPTTWTRIAGVSGENGGWSAGTNRSCRVYWHDNYLYAGILGATNGDAKGWRWDGATWLNIAGNSVNGSWANGTKLGAQQIFAKGNMLGFGLSGSAAGDAEIWFCSTDDYQFSKNAGDGEIGSWSGRTAVSSSLIDPFVEGYLYIGIGSLTNQGRIYGSEIPCADE